MDSIKKKLLFVITQPVVGGAQKYVFDLAKNFSKDYQVSVAIGEPIDGDLFKKLEGEKIKSIFLKHLKRNINVLSDILAVFELIKLFKKEKPDIIHLNSSKAGLLGSAASFFSVLITNNYKPKTIFTAHGWIFKEDISHRTRRISVFLSWLSSKFQDRIICVSSDDFNEAIKYRVTPPRKLSVAHNAVDKIEFLSRQEAREKISKKIGHEISGDTIALVNLGRLYATKGLGYLIESFNKLEKDLILVIFGDGPEKENLKLQVSSYKLQSKVFFVGDIPDASKYLPAFDAMVLSSTKEGLPYSILEAGLASVPVISTNVGGVGEIIKDGENGILIESKNSLAISDAIKSLISDEDKIKRFSAELKKTVSENFSFEEMIERTEWVYKV
jgi:glycosyltransferase involved in cell wall biosynthesis